MQEIKMPSPLRLSEEEAELAREMLFEYVDEDSPPEDFNHIDVKLIRMGAMPPSTLLDKNFPKRQLVRNGDVISILRDFESKYTKEAETMFEYVHELYQYADKKMLENHGVIPTKMRQFYYVSDVNKMLKTILEYDEYGYKRPTYYGMDDRHKKSKFDQKDISDDDRFKLQSC